MQPPRHPPPEATDRAVRPKPAGGKPPRPAADPLRNRLLASLAPEDWQRWQAQLTLVDLPRGRVLYESGSEISHAYFPITALVSLEYVTESGGTAEIALVGHEGVVGVPLFMGDGSTPGRAVVQIAGQGYRMPGRTMREEFTRSAAVMKLLLRYTQALIAHMAQTAVCNRHHPIDQQLCRWLLLGLDRQAGNVLAVTQEQIAQMLGVRREGVTEAALSLQGAGLIHYHRGRITVVDRPGLEQRCCECYGVVKAEFDRLLPQAPPT
jgi:CRP-like cAMP-binding protein